MLRRYWPELAWASFAGACLVVLVIIDEGKTVPFHFIWASLTLVYGVRVWRLSRAVATISTVCLLTGGALVLAALDGSDSWTELAEVPLMASMFVAMVAYARRRETALEHVRRARQREREFVRDASHLLRTPITIARGHAEFLRNDQPAAVAAYDVEALVEELDRLSRIANDLLLLACAEHPRFLNRSRVDAEQLLVDAARRWGQAAQRQWIVNAEAEGVLEADADRLAAALDALIENAVRFTRDGDSIAISSSANGSTVVIEVADSGVGIPRAEQAEIFNRFFRARGKPISGRSGTGLGLAIVKEIVSAHEGTVSVESEPGRGTTFRLVLPRFTADTGLRTASPASVGRGSPSDGLKEAGETEAASDLLPA